MKKAFISSIMIVFFIGVSYSIPVLVNVKESLEGYFPLFNYSVDGDMISFFVVWENVGSLTCDSYLRLKVLGRDKIYNFWSEKQNVAPGGVGRYEAYIYMRNEDLANITIIPYFYYCNELEILDNITLLNYNTSNERDILQNFTNITRLINLSFDVLSKDKLNITIQSTKEGVLYIIPSSPLGWIIPTKKINLKEGFNAITYEYYKPEKTKCCSNVLLLFKSDNEMGMEYREINFTFYPEKSSEGINWKDIILYLSLGMNVVLILVFFLYVLKRGGLDFRKRGQASLEFLIIVGIAMIILAPIIYMATSYKEDVESAKSYLMTKESLKTLKISSLSVYNQGEGSKTTTYINLPSEMEYFNIINNYIVIRIRTVAGVEDMFVELPFNITYTSLPTTYGRYRVEITSLPEGVRYDFYKE